MNAKLCKKLRRKARSATVGKLYRKYTGEWPHTTLLHPDCERYVYHQLKKLAR